MQSYTCDLLETLWDFVVEWEYSNTEISFTAFSSWVSFTRVLSKCTALFISYVLNADYGWYTAFTQENVYRG